MILSCILVVGWTLEIIPKVLSSLYELARRVGAPEVNLIPGMRINLDDGTEVLVKTVQGQEIGVEVRSRSLQGQPFDGVADRVDVAYYMTRSGAVLRDKIEDAVPTIRGSTQAVTRGKVKHRLLVRRSTDGLKIVL